MEENYFFEHADNKYFTPKTDAAVIFSAIKKKQCKMQSIISFLSLLMMFFFAGKIAAQTTLWSTGFESLQTIPNGDATVAASFAFQGSGGNFASSCVQITAESVPSKTYDGSVYTNTALSFTTGKYYVVTVYARITGSNGKLYIKKSTTATHTAIKAVTGTDIILNAASDNVTSSSYVKYTAGFTVTSNETKFIGFQMFQNSTAGAQMILDDISIIEYNTPQSENYCTPTYTNGPGTIDKISNVTLGTLFNNTIGTATSPFYTFYNAVTVPNLQLLSTASVSVTLGSDANQYVGVWIDFNRDGTFQATEGFVSGNAGPSGTVIINITVPADASLGNTRMRVRGGNDSVLLTSQACGESSSSYGETEDYIVNIIASSSCTTPTTQPSSLSLTPIGNTITASFTLASPVADNYLVVVSNSAMAPTPITGTIYTVGSTALGGSNIVVDIDNNNTFTATGLTGTTLYYVYVFSFNSLCVGGPLYKTTSPLNGSTSTLAPAYCTPTGSLDCGGGYTINNVTINTLNNTTACSGGGHTNYAAAGLQTTSVLKGSSYNLSLTVGTGSGTHSAAVWIDFNQNGLFTDVGEYFLISNTVRASSTTSVSIPIPSGALSGNTRMRVRYSNVASVTSTTSCVIGGINGETEDYTITLVTPAGCEAPTAQPSLLSFTPSGTSVAGSFLAASPAPDYYLAVMNTTGTLPAIVNGTTYSIGGTIGAGNFIVNTENENTFTATGLTPNTKYYFFVYSYNSACSGGPLYNMTSPLTGNTTTTSFSFCPPTSNMSSRYINSVQTVGNITNMTNLNTGRSSTNGYGDFTTLPATTQIPGGGINLDITLAISRQYLKAWVDWNNDGTLTNSGTELVYSSSGVLSIATSFGFVVPLGTTPGNYRLRIRSYEASQTFTPCGNLATGETEDYIITVIPDCLAIISTVTDNSRCDSGTVSLTATASGSPTQFRWYNALTGGSLIGNSATGSWTTPSISSTTNYYVTAYNGTCESLIRTKIIAKVNSSSVINVTPSTPEVCGEGNIVTITASGDNMVDDLINENFQGGLGSLSSIIIGGAGDASTQWQSKVSTFVPGLSVWKPAISSRSINDKFAFCTSDKNLLVNTSLESANFPTSAYSNLTLTFRQYYSYYGLPTDYAYVEVSTNNGGSWTAVRTYEEDHAIATNFENVTIDLTSYINNANFKIRFRYNAQFCDGWAIDDVRLFGTKLMNTSFSWGAGTVDAYIDSACLTAYINQSVSTVYIKPTSTQLSATSWSFTATATLSNGCPVSKPITIYNKTKQWLGTTSDWNDANNWKPAGVPDLTNCVFIPNNSVIPGSNYNAYAKNLTVKSTGNLELPSTSNLTVTDFVNANTGGIFNIRDKASLIQINNVANAGIVNIERITPAISKLDYTYWSSPVSAFTLGEFSTSNSYMYSWIPTILNGGGNWSQENDSRVMSPGKGYIIRTPTGHPSNTAYKAQFTGTPNNGDILIPISKGYNANMVTGLVDDEDDEWNLIGNPYPSGLSIAKFIDLPANANVIDGTVYIWTHNSQPSTTALDPFYGDYVLNYTSEDYSTVNKTGATVTMTTATTGVRVPTGYIAAGQSFFIKSASTMQNATTANATFSNDMRETGQNSNFFKLTNTTKKESILHGIPDLEKDRIWLNLTNNSGAFSQILIGYVESATQGLDRGFDGESLGGNDVSFYSVIPQAQLTIQGRGLPFDANDQIILGYNSAVVGDLSIRIDHVAGVFSTQNIYLEDKKLDVLHNLKEKPYVFNTKIGDFNNRFVLRYTDKTLGVEDPVYDNNIQVDFIRSNSILNIVNNSKGNTINTVSLFNVLGKSISKWEVNDKEQTNIKIPIQNLASGVYIVKLKTIKETISKKIIVP